jgi:hypothetical protein
VSVSADGNTAVAGAPAVTVNGAANTGSAWVYTRANGVWTKGPLLVDNTAAAAKQGLSVAISGDGSTIIVGGPVYNSGQGAAWVYHLENGSWVFQAKLTDTAGAGASQGTAVALSSDGNTALVGVPDDASGVGAVWVYTRTNGTWNLTPQQKMVAGDALGFALQGLSVSLSGDGNTALFGGQSDNGGIGAAWVFTRPNGGATWTEQQKLVGGTPLIVPNQGHYVALSSDGSTALVSGWHDNGNTGAVWAWVRSGSTWTQQQKFTPSDETPANGSFFGSAVSLSSNGNTAVIGGYHDNGGTSTLNVGATWIYSRSGTSWHEVGKFEGTGASGTPAQGISVAISQDGHTVLTGGPGDTAGAGAFWVFFEPKSSSSVSVSSSQNPSIVGQSVTFTATGHNRSDRHRHFYSRFQPGSSHDFEQQQPGHLYSEYEPASGWEPHAEGGIQRRHDL